LDNRGSHFYLAMWWAEAMATQTNDPSLASVFEPLARALTDAREEIIQELLDCQGKAMDIGGYYFPDPVLTSQAMRPSVTFNQIIDDFAS